VNDDPVLDLFPFDFLDFSPPPLLPPIAGGSPDLQDFANVLEDIITAPWELAKKVGKMVQRLWDWIWDNIGGAARWLYNQVEDFSWWLWHQVEHWGGVVRDAAVDAGLWVWKQVEHWGGVVRDAAVDAGLWVWKQVEHWGGVVLDAVVDAANWVWKQVEHWGGVALDAAWDSAKWIYQNTVPPIMGAMESVADVFRDALELVGKTIRDALEAVGDTLAAAIKWPWEHIMEPFGNIVEDKLAIPRRLIRGEYTSLLDLFDDITDPPIPLFVGIVGAIILGLVIAMITTAITTILVAPLCLPHTQDIQRGVGAELLTVGVVQEALNRDFIDEATADDHLSRMGYSGQAKNALLQLRNIIPGPTDLVRMAVREVFSPQLRRELTLDAEFPAPFAEYAALQGISEEWAGNYWAAHWDLPSPSQGYEMLHRGLIEPPQLVNLIKALDYAPAWRQHLIDIAYSPITRVDLRRLRKQNIISPEQVFKGYKALGYDDEKAGWLRDFTEKFYSPDDKSQLDDFTDLAASTIRTAYRRHVILRDEALDKLVDIGMTEDVADFLLSIDDAQLALNPTTDAGVSVRDLTVPVLLKAYSELKWERVVVQQELEALGYLAWEADLLLQLEDVARERELTDLEEAVVREEYVKRAIERPIASSRLDALKVPPERRDLLLRRWDLQAAQKTRELTVAQLQRGIRDGLLEEVDVFSRFSGMGYNEADAKFLVDDVDKTPEGIARRLSVSQLSRAYKLGAITDAKLTEQLLALGYTEEDAKTLVDIATPAPAAKERQLSAGQLTVGFRAGLVTEAELLEGLIALGYAQTDAELLRDIAAQKPEPAARKLSVAQLKELFKAETIDKAGLLAELLALGYTDRDAGWIADLIAPEE
jgi:hypothetical protein